MGDGLILSGQVFSLIGILLITVSGIFGEKPIRHYYHIKKNIDREELDEDRDETFDIATVATSEKILGDPAYTDPVTKADYDALTKRIFRGIFGAFCLVIGITFQMGGVIIC